jgi:hypothetical protein
MVVGKVLAVSVAILAIVIGACGSDPISGPGWRCYLRSGGCICTSLEYASTDTVSTCSAQSVGGVCWQSPGYCHCSPLGCAPSPSDAGGSFLCDCSALGVGGNESTAVQTCSAPRGAVCCFGTSRGYPYCSCTTAPNMGCGAASPVASCDVSTALMLWDLDPTTGSLVTDCTNP